MAERPTPHGIVLCTLIVLSALPSNSLESCTVHPSSGRIVYDFDNIDDDNDDDEAKEEEDCDDGTNNGSNDGRYPSLSSGIAGDNDREQQMVLWDGIREYVLSSIQGRGGGGGGEGGGGGYDPSPSSVLAALRSIATTNTSSSSNTRNSTRNSNSSPDKILLSYLSHTVLRSVDTLHDYMCDVLGKCTQKGAAANVTATNEPILDPDCVLGVYVRKRVLGFDMLSFESAARLWEECQNWLGEGWDWLAHAEDDDEEKNVTSPTSSSSRSASLSSSWPPTTSQLSSHLHSLCLDPANTNASDATTSGATPPIYESTIEHLANMSQIDPTLPKLHYAKFLACLRNGERIGAVESLHRYFDYAVIAGRKEAVGRLLDYNASGGDGSGPGGANDAAAAANSRRGGGANARGQQQHQRQGGPGGAGGANPNDGSGGGNDPLKPLSRYAPLLMAMLHHSHGHHGLARKSAEEAIRVGQQCSDGSAVTLALGWLALLDQEMGTGGDDTSGGTGEELWSLCRSRATRHGPSSLSARSSLALARGRVQNVGQAPSLSSSAASRGSARAGTGANGALGGGGGGGGGGLGLTMSSFTVVASNLAAAWSDLASSTTSAPTFASTARSSAAPPHLAAMASSQPETGAADTTPFDCPTSILPVNSHQTLNDIDQILRLQALLGSSLWDGVGRGDLSSMQSKAALARGGDINNLSATELALAATKIAMEAMGGNFGATATAAATAHQRCLDKMVDLRLSYPQMDADVWSNAVSLVLHDWCTRLGLEGSTLSSTSLPSLIRLHISSGIASSTESQGSKFSNDQIESILLLMEAQSASLSSQKRYEQAMEITQRSIRLGCQYGLHVHHARSLLRLANLRLDCIPSQPTLVLPALLECLSVCEQHAIDPFHAAALGALGKIHLLMGNCRIARSVINAAMPAMIQAAAGDVVAEALLTLVKCDLTRIHEGDNNGSGGKQNIRLLHRSLTMLSEAERISRDMSNMCTLRELYYLRAQICNLLGPEFADQRGAASKKFVDTSKWLRGESATLQTSISPSNLSSPDSITLVAESLGSMCHTAMTV